MAAPADYWDSADLKALTAGGLVREDVMDKIWDISRIPLPFTDAIVDDVAENDFTEWTIDELPAPDLANAVVSGSDATGNDAQGGTRVGNHCQNSIKVVAVTERAQTVKVVGRTNEFAYQLMMRQQSIRRDVEAIALTNQASVADDNNTIAGLTGGFDAWVETNFNQGATGTVGGFDPSTKLVVAHVAGTSRGLTETNLSDRIEEAFEQNGNPTLLMSRPKLIKRIARFLFGSATVATPTANVRGTGGGDAQVSQGFINVMITDYGTTLELVPNRIYQDVSANVASLFGIDVQRVGLKFLKRFSTRPLGKLGLSERSQISTDWAVAVYNEKAHFNIRDLQTTTAVVA